MDPKKPREQLVAPKSRKAPLASSSERTLVNSDDGDSDNDASVYTATRNW
jgi:hypothetical protein